MGRRVGIAAGLVGALIVASASAAATPKRTSKRPTKTYKSSSKSKSKHRVVKTKPRHATHAPSPSPSPSASAAPPVAEDFTTTAAYRYGMMTPETCLAELATRKVAFKREVATLGIVTPVRLTGPLHGIELRTNEDAKHRTTSRWEIADCRLILALDDFFVQVLAKHDVVEVRHYSMYRQPPAGFPEGEIGTRHPGGLALDAARFIKRDGSYLDVDDHYHGAIGQRSCGETADPPNPATPEAVEIRAILCEAVAARLFNVMLTPNHDRPHHNHFHLEVTAGKKWFLVK